MFTECPTSTLGKSALCRVFGETIGKWCQLIDSECKIVVPIGSLVQAPDKAFSPFSHHQPQACAHPFLSSLPVPAAAPAPAPTGTDSTLPLPGVAHSRGGGGGGTTPTDVDLGSGGSQGKADKRGGAKAAVARPRPARIWVAEVARAGLLRRPSPPSVPLHLAARRRATLCGGGDGQVEAEVSRARWRRWLGQRDDQGKQR